MFARIYQPSPNAMQSGRGNSRHWVLELPRSGKGSIDPLTGTYRSTDMSAQLDLKFESLEAAIAYAKANNIPHRVIKPRTVRRISRSYAENFAYERKLPWTH